MSTTERPSRPERDPGVVASAVGDVDFELSQLVDTGLVLVEFARELDTPGAEPTVVDSTLQIACLESGLLHVRSLTEFFDSASERDVTASDFIGTWWSPPKTEALKRLRTSRGLLDKHLSHLTWERAAHRAENADGENPRWSVAGLAADVLIVFETFVAELKRRDSATRDSFDGTLAKSWVNLFGSWPAVLGPQPAVLPSRVRRLSVHREPPQP